MLSELDCAKEHLDGGFICDLNVHAKWVGIAKAKSISLDLLEHGRPLHDVHRELKEGKMRQSGRRQDASGRFQPRACGTRVDEQLPVTWIVPQAGASLSASSAVIATQEAILISVEPPSLEIARRLSSSLTSHNGHKVSTP